MRKNFVVCREDVDSSCLVGRDALSSFVLQFLEESKPTAEDFLVEAMLFKTTFP